MKTKKENLILLIGMIAVLGTHLVSCEKIPPPPVVEPELMPRLELSVTPQGEIPYGEVATLSWQTVNALRVFVDGERQENYKEGNKGTGKLFKNTTFVVRATNVKLYAEEVVEVKVGDWMTSTFGLVSYFPWRYKEFRVSSINGVIMSTIYLTEEELSWISYYHKDGKVSYSSTSKVVFWYIEDKNTIVINGTSFKLKVNQEEMIISYEITYNGQPAWFDMVLVHASDTPTDPD